MALKNAGRELAVETALGNEPDPATDDPLVLVHVSGAEGISMPYAYELTMVGTKASEIAASQIIGRRARFGVRKRLKINGQDEPGHVERFGVLETFERIPSINGRRVFRARLVPAFRMTAFEQINRVFEERTLLEVLTQVLQPFELVDFRHELITEIKNEVIPYCVQYNETTFAFVHRLLDRFGIAYRFEHDEELRRERMVLSFGVHRPKNVDVPMRVVSGDSKDFDAIAGFRRSFTAAPQNVRTGDFNMLDPRNPPVGIAVIDDGYAMGGESIGLRAEAFPMPRVDPAAADEAARLRMRRNESTIASASGRTRSTGFFAGRHVPVGFDDTGSGAEGSGWVLRLVTIEAFHFADDRSFFGKAWDFLKAAAGFESGRENDLVGVAAEQLRDRLKEDIPKGVEIYSWLDNKDGAKDPSGLPEFIGKHLGRASAGIVGAAPLLVSSIKSIVEVIQNAFDSASGFACAFEAIPVSDPFRPDRWPTPAAPRPVMAGPHLALVVGPKGVETLEQDIFTDALGRVRIRFPWDNGPDGEAGETAEPSLSHDRNTIWVRVSEGWAGARYGMQFLPRIGDEVLVGFIDGDPERPMVVGRTYNAASGSTHLPFPSQQAGKASLDKVEDLKRTINTTTTRSGLRTRSTPAKGATDAGFHMIRLEDEKGKEQFLIRAQHRLDITSTGSRFDTTRGSQHILVGGGKPAEGEDSGGGQFTSIGGERDLHVKEKSFVKIDADEHHITAGTTRHKTAAFGLDAENILLLCESLQVNASLQIILAVGSSMVKITPAGVFSHGAMIQDKAGSGGSQPSSSVDEALDAGQADPGEPPDFLANQPKGGKGGGRKRQSMGGRESLKVAKGPNNTLVLGKGGIVIDTKGDADFANKVIGDLHDMRKDPAQKAAVDNAMERKNPVTIVRTPAPGDPNPVAIADSVDRTEKGGNTGISDVDANGKETPVLGSGKGTGTEIRYDPMRSPQPETQGTPDRKGRHENLAKTLEDAQADDTGTQPGDPDSGLPQAPPANGGGAGNGGGGAGAQEEEVAP